MHGSNKLPAFAADAVTRPLSAGVWVFAKDGGHGIYLPDGRCHVGPAWCLLAGDGMAGSGPFGGCHARRAYGARNDAGAARAALFFPLLLKPFVSELALVKPKTLRGHRRRVTLMPGDHEKSAGARPLVQGAAYPALRAYPWTAINHD